MLLRLLVALDLISFEQALADLDRQCSVLRDVEICDLCENVAVRTVLLLNRLHILLQDARVEQLSVLDRNEPHQRLCRLDRIALDLDFLQKRILEHVIGQHDALGHLFKDRIQIVEIPRRIDRIAILHEALLRHSIPNMHRKCCPCRRLCRCRRTAEIDLHNRLAHLSGKIIGDRILCGTLRRPFGSALIRAGRRRTSQHRSSFSGSCCSVCRRCRRITQDGGRRRRPCHLCRRIRCCAVHLLRGKAMRQCRCRYPHAEGDGKCKSLISVAVQRRNLLDDIRSLH